jgi:hypothetical protein
MGELRGDQHRYATYHGLHSQMGGNLSLGTFAVGGPLQRCGPVFLIVAAFCASR